jgi:hypothetical protein
MTDMRSLMNIVSEAHLDEMAGAGPARIVHHIKEGTPFIMLSAMRANLSASENKRRTDLIKRKMASWPVSFIVTGGEYHEEGQEVPSEETSFFIMPRDGISPEAFQELGAKLMHAFDQDAFIYGDGQSVTMHERDGTSFSIGDAASFDPAVVKKAPGFSKIKDRKFTFTNTEENPAASGYGAHKAADGDAKVA